VKHDFGCMCDACINARVKKRLDDDREAEEKRVLEQKSQDYIRRRGGEDPRRDRR
jgi:hypothetical protein